MSAFVIASSWQNAPSSMISPPYASRDGCTRPQNAVIDIQDPQLHAPVTFAYTDLEPTAGLDAKRANRSSGPTFRVCEHFMAAECPQGHECSDAHVDRATLNEVRTNILRWLADKEHNFGQQVAAYPHKPISYKIFCSDLKEIVDVPATSITFTRGLFADPGVRTNKRQQASGNAAGKPNEASTTASTPTACGLFASDPALCKWGKWCNQAHIDPHFLANRKQVFSQWAMGHESTFNNMPGDALFVVHDPVIKRSVEVPRHEIAEFTRGLFQQSGSVSGPPNSRKAPSLCLLFQKRRCTAGACCNQIHVKSEAVNRFRSGQPTGQGLAGGLGADLNGLNMVTSQQRPKGTYGSNSMLGGGNHPLNPNSAGFGAPHNGFRPPNAGFNQQIPQPFGFSAGNPSMPGQPQGQFFAASAPPPAGFQPYPQFHPYPHQQQTPQQWEGYQQNAGQYPPMANRQTHQQPISNNYPSFYNGMGMQQAQHLKPYDPQFMSAGRPHHPPYNQTSSHQPVNDQRSLLQPLPTAISHVHSTPVSPPPQTSSASSPNMAIQSITSNRLVSPPTLPETGPGTMTMPQLSLADKPPTPPSQHLSRPEPSTGPALDASMSQTGSPTLGSSPVMRKRNNPYEPAPQRVISPTSPSRAPEVPQYNLSNSSFTGGGGGVNASFINHLSSPLGPNGNRQTGAPGSPLTLQERGAFSQSLARAPSGNQHHSFSHRPPSRQPSYAGGAPEFSFTPLLGANAPLANDSFNFDPVFGSFAEHPDQQGPAMSESFAGRGDMGSGRMRQLLSGSQRRPVDSGVNNRY